MQCLATNTKSRKGIENAKYLVSLYYYMLPAAEISYISRVTITGNHSRDGRDEGLMRGRIQLSTEIEGGAPEILGRTE
jgi:hypothetical protein